MRKGKKTEGVVAEAGADDILPEYDFSKARPNRYAASYRKGGLVITLDPEVTDVFSSATAANEALKSLARIIRAQQQRPPKKQRAHNSPLQPTARRHVHSASSPPRGRG